MQSKIVLRNIARLAEDSLGLDCSGYLDPDCCADGAPIGFGSFKAKLNPMVRAGKIISQQRWCIAHVHHQRINVAIIVEVAECRSAAGLLLGDPCPGLGADILKAAATKIAIDQTRIPVGLLSFASSQVELWIHVAVDLKNVCQAHRCRDRQTRLPNRRIED